MSKRTRGLTLMELVIALGLWLILSAGVFFLWQHTAGSTANILEQQSAFERARGTMDALITGIQMSQRIELNTNAQGLLNNIVVRGYDHQPIMHNFTFVFRPDIETLRSGGQEFSDNIAAIYVWYTEGRRIDITIYTACDEEIVLHGSVDVRYKKVVAST